MPTRLRRIPLAEPLEDDILKEIEQLMRDYLRDTSISIVAKKAILRRIRSLSGRL
jgi:hypothetical protein